MNAQTYRFERNFRVIHNIYVEAMPDKESKIYCIELFKSREFLKYKTMADLVYVEQEQEEQEIIDKYRCLMVSRICANCRYFRIGECGERNMQLMFQHMSVDEIANEREISCSNISTQNCASQTLLRLKKQKVNSNEKMLRILMEKPSVRNIILMILYTVLSRF